MQGALTRSLAPSLAPWPGIGLCVALSGVAILAQHLEEAAVGHPYVEALVIAILLGTAVRTAWSPGARWRSGIAFSAKQLLEVAVTLLGASLSFATILASGSDLLLAIVGVVIVTILASFTIGRSLGLSIRLSLLIACGNAICGNSAIAAVAPVIGARSEDIASSISFTAILGVLMVLGLPLLIPLLGLEAGPYGVLAGMTVYAVPQVLAATIPAGLVATQMGTVVKLVRVLMLGPVVVGLSVFAGGLRRHRDDAPRRLGFFKIVPWFIIGFLILALLRSLGLIPEHLIPLAAKAAGFLTIVSMAALGLGVDLRVLADVGGRVTAAVTLSLVFLLGLSLILVHVVRIG